MLLKAVFSLDNFLITLIAYIIDLIIGDPGFIMHPVAIMGRLISITEDAARRLADKNRTLIKINGFIITGVNLAAALLTAFLIKKIIYLPGKNVGFVLESILVSQMIAANGLRKESMKVYHALKGSGCAEFSENSISENSISENSISENSIKEARGAVSRIVGRDTENLSSEGVIKAAVETVAENFSDGVTAPVLFSFLCGLSGIYLYKMINTMDSMIGYKDEKYKEIGMCAARLDDVVNFIPARISALLMLISGIILRFNIKNAVKVFLKYRYKHASPNSAQTESMAAGLLGIELAGDAYYFGKLYKKPKIGTALRDVDKDDIKRINRIVFLSGILIFITGGIFWYIL